MIVAFLDLLGFSQLVKHDIETADDVLLEFNQIIKTKYIDNLTNPVDSYPESMTDFAKSTSITTFQHMISVSDSLVIGASEKNADDFIKQLSKLVAAFAIRSLEPFRAHFDDVYNVKNEKHAKGRNIQGGLIYYNAFPILFRGGICAGNNVSFMTQFHIFNGKMTTSATNVVGQTYINAYRLEGTDKGPRLFCDESLSNLVSGSVKSKIVQTSRKGVSEILWTYYACEAESCSSEKNCNVSENVFDGLIVPTLNLIRYYKSKGSEEVKHYIELLGTVIKGVELYASDNSIDITYIMNRIQSEFPDYLFISC